MTSALSAIRLSKYAEMSTSPQRQREVNEDRIKREGWDFAGEAEDLDVSGAVNPFEREKLGPWLTDHPPAPWDVLVAWKLDRVSRSALDTLQLLEWLEARGKRLVTYEDGIDTGTSMGRLFVQIAAIFAQLERETIRERTLASRVTLRSLGRWGGENIQYGYRAVKLEDGGWCLDVDPVAADVVQQMFSRVLDGEPVASITRWLNTTEYLAPRDRQRELREQEIKHDQWKESTVMQILRSRSLLGWTVHKGKADPSTPKAPPVVSPRLYEQVQSALDERSRAKVRSPGRQSSPLAGVALCFGDVGGGERCLTPLWHRAQHVPAGRSRQKTAKTYRYYYCKHGHTKQIKADDLEELCVAAFLQVYANTEVTRKVWRPASDPSDELASIRMAIADIAERMASYSSKTIQDALGSQLESLEKREAELAATPTEEARVEHVPTGTTWQEELEPLDAEGRRDLWHRVGFRFAIESRDEGVSVAIRTPWDDPAVDLDSEG